MRKIIVVEFMSLDGVVQAPGGPTEDTSESFKFGGWLVPHSDESLGEALGITYGEPYDLLLGRKTYDIFAAHWPKIAEDKNANESDKKFAEEFNSCIKYVATNHPETLTWKNSKHLGADIARTTQEIKKSGDKNLLVVGSSQFVHTLLSLDLVDELHLFIAPIILGKGKRLFNENSHPRTFKLIKSKVSEKGMLLMNYSRAGEIETGSF